MYKRQVYDNAKVETVALSPSDIPESEEGMEAIEYLLVDDYDLSGLSEKQSAAIKQWVYSGGAMILAKSSGENELSSFDGTLSPLLMTHKRYMSWTAQMGTI